MRRTLVNYIIKNDDRNTYFLTAGVGYGLLEPLREKMGDRFIDVGIAEQSMISIAAGLALSGKRVFTYTMCCFYLRAVEQIKLDLCYQNAKVTMIGVGTGFDYEYHGTSHFALEDKDIMNCLENIEVFTALSKKNLIDILQSRFDCPRYIRVGRFDKSYEFDCRVFDYPKCGGDLKYFKRKYGY